MKPTTVNDHQAATLAMMADGWKLYRDWRSGGGYYLENARGRRVRVHAMRVYGLQELRLVREGKKRPKRIAINRYDGNVPTPFHLTPKAKRLAARERRRA